MNNENLRVLSSTEARKNGRKGGIASGIARREKKELREHLEIALTLPYFTLDGEELTNAEAICRSLIDKALEGDVRAFTVIRDTIGETPVQKALVASDVIPPERYEEIERLLEEAAQEYQQEASA